MAAAAIRSAQSGKLMMSICGAERKTYELGNKYLFQTYTPADHYLTGALEALKQKKPGATIALAYSDDPFSKAVAGATRDQATAMGFKIVLDESYPPDQTDFSAIINKIVSAKPVRPFRRRALCRRRYAGRPLARSERGIKWVEMWWRPTSRAASWGGGLACRSPINGRRSDCRHEIRHDVGAVRPSLKAL